MDNNIECTLSSIDSLHENAPVQRQIVDAEYVRVKPVGPVKDASEIEFMIENNGQLFIDLRDTEIEVAFRVKKGDGSNCAITDKVAPINYVGATMFSTIDLWLNGELVTQRTPNQAFRAIVETLTSYGEDAANSWLQGALFFKDTAGQMGNTDPAPTNDTDPVNKGLKERFELTKGSKRVVTRSRLHVDMFTQPRPLVNFVSMRLKCHKNKDAYCLMAANATPAYKIEIEDMTLLLRKSKLADDVYTSAVGNPAVYPHSRVQIVEYLTPAGGKSWNIANLASGVLPTKIVIGITENAAANGSYTLNPFDFKNHGLESLALVVNGAVHGGAPLEFDFADDQYLQGYWTLMAATGKKYRDEGTLIRRADYKDGYALYAFDLSPSQCDEQYKDADRTGDINVALKFKNAIATSLTLSAYLQYESSLSINAAKQVTLDFAA